MSSPTMLRMRIKGLSTEARATRHEERKELERAHSLRMRMRLEAANIPDKKIARILRRAFFGRSKAKPTAPREPTQGDWIAWAEERARALREDRIAVLRRDARNQHLAYGFLRGVPYRAMEQKCYEPPPWQSKAVMMGEKHCPVELAALAYKGDLDERDLLQRLAQWKDEAGVWQHPNGTTRRDWAHEKQRAAQARAV